MARVKEIKIISVQEAMDNLAAVVGIDLNHPPRLGIIQSHRLVTDADQIGPHEVVWLSGEGSEAVLEILDMTFYTIQRHLATLLESSEVNWDSPKVRKGIQAMVTLAQEAAAKMNEYMALRLGKPLAQKVEERASYQELHYFFHNRFSKKFKENWSEDWKENEEAELLDVSKTGLKDFESVKRDLEYELFSIKTEDGKPYFSPALLRNIKTVCFELSEGMVMEEDPLLKIRAVDDRDLQASARSILNECHVLIEDFYKFARKLEGSSLTEYLSMGLIALFLASNQRNLIQNTSGKSCLQYFQDFQGFLRRAINCNEYQKYNAYPPEKEDKVAHLQLNLTHALCKALFYRRGGIKQEAIGLIHRCMRKGEASDKRTAIKGDTIWNRLLIEDERLRSFLNLFPNGPLFKILDMMREEEYELMAFDPFIQDNLPQRYFDIHAGAEEIAVLRCPCPVRQSVINKATVVEEFLGFLRSMASAKKKHLMINLQDRTSWHEYTRSQSMEKLQRNAEFSSQMIVATLAKNTDFYHQNSEYLNVNLADEFMQLFEKQLGEPEECGFFFPAQYMTEEFKAFTKEALEHIHKTIFEGKEQLSRQNREDFIEIFYQLLILKMIEVSKPDTISFTCKDAIDTGAAEVAGFYGMLQLLFGDITKEIETLRYFLYTPALFIRERAVDPERFNRTISYLDRLDAELSKKGGDKFKKGLEKLYRPEFIKKMSIG